MRGQWASEFGARVRRLVFCFTPDGAPDEQLAGRWSGAATGGGSFPNLRRLCLHGGIEWGSRAIHILTMHSLVCLHSGVPCLDSVEREGEYYVLPGIILGPVRRGVSFDCLQHHSCSSAVILFGHFFVRGAAVACPCGHRKCPISFLLTPCQQVRHTLWRPLGPGRDKSRMVC